MTFSAILFIRSVRRIALPVLIAVFLSGCNTVQPPTDASGSVTSHFYPLSDGATFRYLQFAAGDGMPDTVEYQLRVALSVYGENRLVTGEANAEKILYRFVIEKNAQGNTIALLKNDDGEIIALSGDLAVGSEWMASNSIRASVEAAYEEYLIPGRTASYRDVIVVKYRNVADGSDSYTLRFFARGCGIIRERRIVKNASTEIGTLLLMDWHTAYKQEPKQAMSQINLDNPFLNQLIRTPVGFDAD